VNGTVVAVVDVVLDDVLDEVEEAWRAFTARFGAVCWRPPPSPPLHAARPTTIATTTAVRTGLN
jgi:hypothetical protein